MLSKVKTNLTDEVLHCRVKNKRFSKKQPAFLTFLSKKTRYAANSVILLIVINLCPASVVRRPSSVVNSLLNSNLNHWVDLNESLQE